MEEAALAWRMVLVVFCEGDVEVRHLQRLPLVCVLVVSFSEVELFVEVMCFTGVDLGVAASWSCAIRTLVLPGPSYVSTMVTLWVRMAGHTARGEHRRCWVHLEPHGGAELEGVEGDQRDAYQTSWQAAHGQ